MSDENVTTLKLTFDGVRLPVKNDISSPEGAATSVIVDGRRLELPKFGEELLDVGIRNAKVQVGHHEFARA